MAGAKVCIWGVPRHWLICWLGIGVLFEGVAHVEAGLQSVMAGWADCAQGTPHACLCNTCDAVCWRAHTKQHACSKHARPSQTLTFRFQ